jgi:hypothetical protein
VAVVGLAALGAQRGLTAGRNAGDLPLPVRGYQVYMVGELHGIAENPQFQAGYLERLSASAGLRDVAIEEDAVYEERAQAFVNGDIPDLPPELCLRAGIIRRIRQLNATRPPAERIRVHLTDIDSPAHAICEHLSIIRSRLKAGDVAIPPPAKLHAEGVAAIAALKARAADARLRGALRTVERSLEASTQGFDVGTGLSKGSPYLESRESAVAANIVDLVTSGRAPALLVLYGSDHVSRKIRHDGGPERNREFKPVALRLQEAGLRVYSVLTFPLKARVNWRGRTTDMPWEPVDNSLATGRTFDRILAESPGLSYFHVPAADRPKLASQDMSNAAVDAFVLFRRGTPLDSECRAQ